MRICMVHVFCLKSVGTVCSWQCSVPWRVRSMRGLTVRQHSFSLSPYIIMVDTVIRIISFLGLMWSHQNPV